MTGWLSGLLGLLRHKPSHVRRRGTPLVWSTVAAAVAASALTVAIVRSHASELSIDSTQRQVIETLEDVLLHDSVVPQYARVVNQFDSRGFVAGIGDFSTADGGALEVVNTYTARVGDNELARGYLVLLTQLAHDRSGDTTGLVGFPDAWRRASLDPAFRDVQVGVRESRAYQPAVAEARDLGLLTPLGLAVIYDSVLQHGVADVPDGLPVLIEQANRRAGGSPRDVPERDWLAAFLDVRRAVLLGPSDPAHFAIWPLSTGRIDVLSALLAAHRDSLAAPFEVSPYGTPHVINPGVDQSDPEAGDQGRLSIGPSVNAAHTSAPPTSALNVGGPRSTDAGPVPTTHSSSARAAPATAAPVTPQAGLIVRIVNVRSGKPFGVDGGSFEDGANLVQKGDPGAAQQWRMTVSPAGCFTLLNMRSGKAIDNPAGSRDWGAWMQQWAAGPPGNPNQAWCFDPAGNGNYLIRSLASGLVLDLTDGGTSDGNPIQQWGTDGSDNPNQKWKLQLVG